MIEGVGATQHGRRLGRTLRTVLVCLCLLGAAIVPGCGGPSSPSPITETPPPPPPPTPPAPPAPPPVLKITRILAFGDSMTAGTTSPALLRSALTAGLPQSYPAKLQELLSARYSGQSVAVFNAGKAGEKVVASDTLRRFNDALSEAKPELVLLMEGANDLNNAGEMVNAVITGIVGNLEDMVKEAGRRNIPIMIGTLPPQRLPKGMGAPHIGRFNAALRDMASKKGAILVDVNGQMPEASIGQDGLHPTEAGYQKLAEIYLDAIKGRYEAPPAATPSMGTLTFTVSD